MIHVRPRVEVTVKVKANMQFKKIFEVAEVFLCRFPRVNPRAHHALNSETVRQRSWCASLYTCQNTRIPTWMRVGSLRFVYDGERLTPTETPAEVSCLFPFLFTPLTRIHLSQRSMEDGDVIDAHLQQARVQLILILSTIFTSVQLGGSSCLHS